MMRSTRLTGLTASALLVGCSHLPAREPSSIEVRSFRRGGYVLVDDAGREVPEREFARLYRNRVNSTEADSLDHPHLQSFYIGLGLTTVLAGVSVVSLVLANSHCHVPQPGVDCDGWRGTGWFTGGAAALVLALNLVHVARGSPEDHELTRGQAERLVDIYNSTKPATGHGARIQPTFYPFGIAGSF